jgi:hypothetical protein
MDAEHGVRIAVTGKPFVGRKNARNRFPSDQLLSLLNMVARAAQESFTIRKLCLLGVIY